MQSQLANRLIQVAREICRFFLSKKVDINCIDKKFIKIELVAVMALAVLQVRLARTVLAVESLSGERMFLMHCTHLRLF